MQPFIRWFKAETKKALTSRLVELWLKWRQIFIMLFQFSDKTFRLWIIPSDGWSGNGVNGQDYPVEISMWRHDTGNCQSSQYQPDLPTLIEPAEDNITTTFPSSHISGKASSITCWGKAPFEFSLFIIGPVPFPLGLRRVLVLVVGRVLGQMIQMVSLFTI